MACLGKVVIDFLDSTRLMEEREATNCIGFQAAALDKYTYLTLLRYSDRRHKWTPSNLETKTLLYKSSSSEEK